MCLFEHFQVPRLYTHEIFTPFPLKGFLTVNQNAIDFSEYRIEDAVGFEKKLATSNNKWSVMLSISWPEQRHLTTAIKSSMMLFSCKIGIASDTSS